MTNDDYLWRPLPGSGGKSWLLWISLPEFVGRSGPAPRHVLHMLTTSGVDTEAEGTMVYRYAEELGGWSLTCLQGGGVQTQSNLVHTAKPDWLVPIVDAGRIAGYVRTLKDPGGYPSQDVLWFAVNNEYELLGFIEI